MRVFCSAEVALVVLEEVVSEAFERGLSDTDAFKAQSRDYAAHLRAGGLTSVIELECTGRHHFDVLDDVVDLSTTLGMLALGEL